MLDVRVDATHHRSMSSSTSPPRSRVRAEAVTAVRPWHDGIPTIVDGPLSPDPVALRTENGLVHAGEQVEEAADA